jgi:hypothetical protein
MLNFLNVLLCSLSFAIADFGVEYFRDAPNYMTAATATWNQFVALQTYYWVWVRPEMKELQWKNLQNLKSSGVF